MHDNLTIEKTREHIKSLFSEDAGGHDYWHSYRVWKLAKHIAKEEDADLFIVELAALLHDIADWKFNDGNLSAGPLAARTFLEKINVEKNIIDKVCYIVEHVSYKGAGVADIMESKEGKIVQDADRLDAIGAMGIGRTFAYNGQRGRPMHDPEIKPVLHATKEAYLQSKGTTINHFHEKLLLLKDRMHTKTARRLAQGRHKFMEQFLEEFHKEWEGEL